MCMYLLRILPTSLIPMKLFVFWFIIILILRRAGQYNIYIYKVPELNEAVNDKEGLKK